MYIGAKQIHLPMEIPNNEAVERQIILLVDTLHAP